MVIESFVFACDDNERMHETFVEICKYAVGVMKAILDYHRTYVFVYLFIFSFFNEPNPNWLMYVVLCCGTFFPDKTFIYFVF